MRETAREAFLELVVANNATHSMVYCSTCFPDSCFDDALQAVTLADVFVAKIGGMPCNSLFLLKDHPLKLQ